MERGVFPGRTWSRRGLRKPSIGAMALGLMAVAALSGEAGAASGWPVISLVPRFGGLVRPVQVTHAGDGSGRLFAVEQAGRVRIARDGALAETPFLDISGRVLSGGEQGLLGLAFPPGYAAKGRFYVDYTRVPDGATVIARYRLTADPEVADPASEEVLLVVGQPFPNHNGGQIAFGPDGFLYIGMGDGGSGGDPLNSGQDPETLLGKMLRIDVESPAAVAPYAVPPSNPFASTPGHRAEIWAFGLRNPWRFAFDRQTGDLYIGDVGQESFEEVDFQPAASGGGENYGWRLMEGSHCFGDPACDAAGLALPVAEYGHALGCSVTGGTVYRGAAYPRMQGVYLYADFCSGRIWGLRRDGAAWQSAALSAVPLALSSFGEDEAGNLYATDYGGGGVHEIVAPNVPPSPPQLVSPDDGLTGVARDVTFSWRPSADPEGDPVTYAFYLDTDPSFTGTVPVPVAAAGRAGRPANATGRWAYAFLLPGVLLTAGIRRVRKARASAPALVAAALIVLYAWAGCGGGGAGVAGQPSPGPPAPVAHAVAGLLPDTTYYWKVVASDGEADSASPTRRFVTGS